jgi:hypothetical protein
MTGDHFDGVALLPGDDTRFRIRFPPAQEHKAGQKQMHFDLTSTSPRDRQQTVARPLALSARHIDTGQRPEEGHVVPADPEDNEFCIIEPGSNFLPNCGAIRALACEGSQQAGCPLQPGAGLGPGPRDRDPLTAQRPEDHLRRSTADNVGSSP